MPRGIGHRPPAHYGHEGYKWKDDLPPDYKAEELRSYLPGRNVGVKFIEWYRQDVKGRGMTVPFMNYSGPLNASNIGEPVNDADRFAKIHDLEYAFAKFRYDNGKITEQQYKREIDAADIKFMKSNGWNVVSSMNIGEQLASMIGALGIGVKYVAESVAGQMYPSTEKDDAANIPTTSTNLATKLMNNLKTNISRNSQAEESSSMVEHSNKALKNNEGERIETGQGGGSSDLPSGGVLPETENPGDMANLTGTGKEQASGGASSDGQMVYYIEKPLSIFGNKISTYTKSHKFMTFGFAPNACIGLTPAQDVYFLTSYLAEVPWHIPALYLNQSEFDLIPSGSKIKEVQVHVVYRGSTIQFETNASATGLATLNQINDIAVAEGLNRTGWGSNVKFTSFDGAQPMKPTGVAKPQYGPLTGTYRGMVRDYYGSNNDAAGGLFIDDIPKHQIGRQTFLYNYWANSARSGIQTATTFRQFGGWPCLAEKIRQIDGKTVVNQVVTSMNYKPKFAPIKTPLKSVGHGMPFPEQNGITSIPIGGNLAANRQVNIQISGNAPTSSTQIEAGINAEGQTLLNNFSNVPTFNIYTPIEKSQIGKSGYWGETDPHIQPSLHIGVQPVPALSSAATLTENAQFNNWTDTRAYWEVVATMVVDEYSPTAWPYATQANVPLGENVTWIPTPNQPAINKNARDDGSTFCGLYQLGVPDLPN